MYRWRHYGDADADAPDAYADAPESRKNGREWIIPTPPDKGDWLIWKHKQHAIYDSFPDGKKVDPEEIGLNFDDYFQANEVWSEKCWRLMKDGESWALEYYVAVQFEHDGKFYFTTYSRSDSVWLDAWWPN